RGECDRSHTLYQRWANDYSRWNKRARVAGSMRLYCLTSCLSTREESEPLTVSVGLGRGITSHLLLSVSYVRASQKRPIRVSSATLAKKCIAKLFFREYK